MKYIYIMVAQNLIFFIMMKLLLLMFLRDFIHFQMDTSSIYKINQFMKLVYIILLG